MVGSWIPPEDSGEAIGGSFNAAMAVNPKERIMNSGDKSAQLHMNADMH